MTFGSDERANSVSGLETIPDRELHSCYSRNLENVFPEFKADRWNVAQPRFALSA